MRCLYAKYMTVYVHVQIINASLWWSVQACVHKRNYICISEFVKLCYLYYFQFRVTNDELSSNYSVLPSIFLYMLDTVFKVLHVLSYIFQLTLKVLFVMLQVKHALFLNIYINAFNTWSDLYKFPLVGVQNWNTTSSFK